MRMTGGIPTSPCYNTIRMAQCPYLWRTSVESLECPQKLHPAGLLCKTSLYRAVRLSEFISRILPQSLRCGSLTETGGLLDPLEVDYSTGVGLQRLVLALGSMSCMATATPPAWVNSLFYMESITWKRTVSLGCHR